MYNSILRKLGLIGVFVFLWGYSHSANADNFLECNACSNSQELAAVNTWAKGNISVSEAQSGVTKELSVINLYQAKITTYRVGLKQTPVPPPIFNDYLPYSTPITTPAYYKQLMQDFRVAKQALDASFNNLVIPTSEVSSAWQFVSCAFCENNVSRFLNDSLYGDIRTVTLTVETLAQTFGLLSTGIPNTYLITLEAGGHLEIVMTLTNDPISLKVVVTKVVDENGNTVPFTSDKLKNLLVQIASIRQAEQINSFINRFQLYVPIKMGYVVITDCPDSEDEDPIPRPCGGG